MEQAKGVISELRNVDLRIFVTTVDEKSLSAAARVLGLSQPTITLRLQRLEDQLQLRLIERRGGISLTDHGRELYNRARHILRLVDVFTTTAHEMRELERGHLRIGFSTPPFALPLIGRLRRAAPRLKLSFSQSNTWDLTEALRSLAIDVAIMSLREPLPEFLNCRMISRHRLTAVARTDFPLPDDVVLDWPAIAGMPLVLRQVPSVTRTVIDETVAKLALQMENMIELPSREAQIQAVCEGLGVGLLFAAEIGRDDRLRQIRIDDPISRAAVYIAALQDTKGLPGVEAIFSLAAEAAEDPA